MSLTPQLRPWRLTLVFGVAGSFFSGCETASPPAVETPAPEMAAEPAEEEGNDLPPLIVFAGERRDENFDSHFEIPLSTVSPERRGPLDAPFEFHRTRQQRIDPDRYTGQVFPLNNRTGNLLFYRDVGIPQLKIERLDDEHIRIWARVHNRTLDDIHVRVTCMGREGVAADDRYDYEAIIFRKDVYRDFSFLMTGDEARRFTLAVTGLGK